MLMNSFKLFVYVNNVINAIDQLSTMEQNILLCKDSSAKYASKPCIVAALNNLNSNGSDTSDKMENTGEDVLFPVFRVTVLDEMDANMNSHSNKKLLSFSFEELYDEILVRVQQCQEQQQNSKLNMSHQFQSAGTFFGISLPVVRCAIENLVESVACMIIPENKELGIFPYVPLYRYPTVESIAKVKQYQAELNSTSGDIIPLSISGCARTDMRIVRIQEDAPIIPNKKTYKLLTKNTGTAESTVVTPNNKSKSKESSDQNEFDDAIFGENEVEYLDWYTVL